MPTNSSVNWVKRVHKTALKRVCQILEVVVLSVNLVNGCRCSNFRRFCRSMGAKILGISLISKGIDREKNVNIFSRSCEMRAERVSSRRFHHRHSGQKGAKKWDD